jgi:hypothetical protein
MRLSLLILAGLTGCATPAEDLVPPAAAIGVASIAAIQRSPVDAVLSLISGRDCSVVRLDRGEPYCRPEEPPPDPPPVCTRSLGTVDCWDKPPAGQRGVADGPAELTPSQETNRTRRWGL